MQIISCPVPHLKIAIFNPQEAQTRPREVLIKNFAAELNHHNISHSNGWLAIVKSNQAQVGIDLEATATTQNYLDIAQNFFHQSEYLLLKQTQNQNLFTKAWVIKEAWCKARGIGINDGLPALDLSDWLKNGVETNYFIVQNQPIFYQILTLNSQTYHLAVVLNS